MNKVENITSLAEVTMESCITHTFWQRRINKESNIKNSVIRTLYKEIRKRPDCWNKHLPLTRHGMLLFMGLLNKFSCFFSSGIGASPAECPWRVCFSTLTWLLTCHLASSWFHKMYEKRGGQERAGGVTRPLLILGIKADAYLKGGLAG